jgi:DNA-nicking Smr family endonuclease
LSKITDKDKKDWENFLNSKKTILNKDNNNLKVKNEILSKSIDLHGCTLVEANKKINQFIEECYDKGINKINIVTGKGSRSKNKEDPFRSSDLGILKYSVPDFIKNNLELMKKINQIDFDAVNSPFQGSFDIFLRKKK